MESIDNEQLTNLLGFDVHAIEPEPVFAGGYHSRVYSCQSAAGDLILRVCRGQQGYHTHYSPEIVDWEKWMDQRWAINKAREVGVPAPEVIYSNRRLRWVVMKRLPGVPIDNRYETWQSCPYDEKAFGTELRRLQSVTPLGWGPINDDGDALFQTWLGFLVALAESAFKTCRDRNSLPTDLLACLEREWIPALGEVEIQEPSLLHMESLGFANIMYDPDSRLITGIVDFEDCIGGDPLYELLWMKYYFEDEGENQTFFDFERFGAGYGPTGFDNDRAVLYEPFPYLDKLRWIAPGGERAQSYTKKLEAIVDIL